MSVNSKGAAIVTGAAQGIGRAIAIRLVRDGYDVVLNDLPRQEETLKQVVSELQGDNSTGKYLVITGDVSKEEDVKALVDGTVQALGGLDVMIANAGIPMVVSFLDHTVEQWDKVMNINARSTFLCYKYAAHQMVKQGHGGRIVGAASIAGKQGLQNQVGYCASKFAVRGMTQTAAIELGEHGITVNAYAPGCVDTPLLKDALSVLGDYEERKEMVTKRVPLNILGQPDDIAGLVSYLVSPEARFITGQSISINGGWFFD